MELKRNYLDLHKRIRYMRGHTKKKKKRRERARERWMMNQFAETIYKKFAWGLRS